MVLSERCPMDWYSSASRLKKEVSVMEYIHYNNWSCATGFDPTLAYRCALVSDPQPEGTIIDVVLSIPPDQYDAPASEPVDLIYWEMTISGQHMVSPIQTNEEVVYSLDFSTGLLGGVPVAEPRDFSGMTVKEALSSDPEYCIGIIKKMVDFFEPDFAEKYPETVSQIDCFHLSNKGEGYDTLDDAIKAHYAKDYPPHREYVIMYRYARNMDNKSYIFIEQDEENFVWGIVDGTIYTDKDAYDHAAN